MNTATNTVMTGYGLEFLGVGNAQARELGDSAAVLLHEGQPRLLIDCGPSVPARHAARFGSPPPALFITHTHLDHVGGMESLFVTLWFDPQRRGRTPLFVPVTVLPLLHQRVASHPNVLAEGGVNFWQAFQVVPVATGFWLDGLWFDVFPVRHHALNAAYGLALRGSFVYTGDTRPVPEVLAAHATGQEVVFHDCALRANPSHTGLDDLAREYPATVRQRLVLYHYEDAEAGDALDRAGYRAARPGEYFPLPAPLARPLAAAPAPADMAPVDPTLARGAL